VVPVLLPGATLPEQLPRFLRRLTWVDLRSDAEAFHRLVAGIRGVALGPDAPGDAGPLITERSDHFTDRLPPVNTEDYHLALLLRKVKYHWIEGMLKSSMPVGGLLEVGKKMQRDTVGHRSATRGAGSPRSNRSALATRG